MKIVAHIPEKDKIYIKDDKTEIELSDKNNTGIIEGKPERLTVFKKPSESNHTVPAVLLHILTGVFQGLFYIVTVNIASDWYNQVDPVVLSCDFSADTQKTDTVTISLKKAKYIKDTDEYVLPMINLSPKTETEIKYEFDETALQNGRFFYIKKILCMIFSIVFFVSFGVFLISKDIPLISLAVLFAGAAVGTVISMLQIKKQKKIYMKVYDSIKRTIG